jgi:hypothetical protein
MLIDEGARSRIDRFLGQVEAHLIDRQKRERNRLLHDLEDRIHEALARRGGRTAADVGDVLEEMDPPESYGAARPSKRRRKERGAARPLEVRLMIGFLIAGIAGLAIFTILRELIHPERSGPSDGTIFFFVVCEGVAAGILAWILLRKFAATPVEGRGPVYAGISLFFLAGVAFFAVCAVLARVQGYGSDSVALTVIGLLVLLPAAAFGRTAHAPVRLPLRGDLQRLGRIAPATASAVLLTILAALPVAFFALLCVANGVTRSSRIRHNLPDAYLWAGIALMVGALVHGVLAVVSIRRTSFVKRVFWPVLERASGTGARLFAWFAVGSLVLATAALALYFGRQG